MADAQAEKLDNALWLYDNATRIFRTDPTHATLTKLHATGTDLLYVQLELDAERDAKDRRPLQLDDYTEAMEVEDAALHGIPNMTTYEAENYGGEMV